jgi:hypothetical protein
VALKAQTVRQLIMLLFYVEKDQTVSELQR